METSKGEQKVINLLRRHGISFIREVSFEGLTGANNNLLRFDFGILNNKKQIIALIEVDGQQHFEYVKFFHKSKNDFYRQVEWDRKKNKFCLKNNIPLIRIPYWDIDSLTFDQLLHNPKYRVKNKEHNMLLAREVNK